LIWRSRNPGRREIGERRSCCAEDGKAKEAPRRPIAETLGLAASKARLVAGAKSRLKQAAATGAPEAPTARLAGLRDATGQARDGREVAGQSWDARKRNQGVARRIVSHLRGREARRGAGEAPAIRAAADGRIGEFISRHRVRPEGAFL
jgi:type V secretory pathway adhesin AidA